VWLRRSADRAEYRRGPPAEYRGRPTPNSGRLPPVEQPHDVPPNHPRQPPSRPDPAPAHPIPQRIPTSQGQCPEKPPLHPLNMNGQPLCHPHPPPPPQLLVPRLGHSVPVFGQLQNPMGQVIGLVHRGSFTVPGRAGAGPSVRQLPPGYPHMPPQMYPQMQPRVHQQIPPHMNPQIPPHAYPQIQPQMQMRGPIPMHWGGPPGPPPPYSGPGITSGEPTFGVNQSGPPTTERRTSGSSGTRATSQPGGTELDPSGGQEDDDAELDALPISRREAAGRVPTRANPARRARPTQLRESD